MMTARFKGDERTYEADFSSTNAMCRIEAATGLTYVDTLAKLAVPKRPPVLLARQFLGAALIDPANATPDQVGDILDDIGGARIIFEAARALMRKPRKRRSSG